MIRWIYFSCRYVSAINFIKQILIVGSSATSHSVFGILLFMLLHDFDVGLLMRVCYYRIALYLNLSLTNLMVLTSLEVSF